MMKKLSRFRKRLWAAAAALAIISASAFPAEAAEQTRSQADTQFLEARQLIENLHISGGKITESESAGTIEELLQALGDPYTDYFDPAEWKLFIDSLELNYTGIGMRIGADEYGYAVVEVFDRSPAKAAGVQSGDRIVQVAGVATEGLSLDQVSAAVRGPEGTEVKLTVSRNGALMELTAVRAPIHLPAVSGGMMTGGVGYLKVASFSDEADEQFAAMLAELMKQPIKGLVVDLRDNPGGLLETAQHIAEQFISEGVLIHTRDKYNEDEPLYIVGGREVSFPVAVLVNENSASASEVLTAALQDYRKAVAVGTKTYGKGSVQSLYALSDGGVLKITTQEYLSPNKRTVNQVGLLPDVPTEGRVPQLLLGLHAAGLQQFRLEAAKMSYKLNGQVFYDTEIPWLTADGTIYMPARVVAALAGEPLVWNEERKGVQIGTGSAAFLFDAENGFKIEGGTGFLALDKFLDQFPRFDWVSLPDKMILVTKGNGL